MYVVEHVMMIFEFILMELIGINGGICCGGSYDDFELILMKLIEINGGVCCGSYTLIFELI